VESDSSITAILDSWIGSVDAAEQSVRDFARETGFGEQDQYFIGLAAREILINAVKHGNRFEPDKKVELHMSRKDSELTIDVMDEGQGFQLAGVPDPRAPENRERRPGRGLMMAASIMDQVLVEKRSPSGTHIRLTKHLVTT
jgi:serine/threonine-protein kinase RsbW